MTRSIWTRTDRKRLKDWVTRYGRNRQAIVQFAKFVDRSPKAVYLYALKNGIITPSQSKRRWTETEIQQLRLWVKAFGRSRDSIARFLKVANLPFSYAGTMAHVDRAKSESRALIEWLDAKVYAVIAQSTGESFDPEPFHQRLDPIQREIADQM